MDLQTKAVAVAVAEVFAAPLLDRPTGRLLFPIAAVLLALLADLASVVAFLCCQERFYCSWLIFNFPV